MLTKQEALKTYYGYDTFRDGQEPILDNILQHTDVLAIMPTGAGKSLCFQIPALIMDGITLVISPLVSLMRDQVMQLVQMGIPAAFLNSSLTQRQYAIAMERAIAGRYKIIYVAPERLQTPRFQDFVKGTKIAMVAVDEAHCISQWGQDFRTAYLEIPQFVSNLPTRPVVTAFTATATPEVRLDIAKQLQLDNPFQTITGFDRENLYFEVRHPTMKKPPLRSIVSQRQGQCGIIYCSTRKNVEDVCSFLQEEGISATRYHAGLEAAERADNQENFLFGRTLVMVATNAFGMGIDKPDVRYVVHYNMPRDMESYYQEAGRAGRDGAQATCIILYSGQDVHTHQFLIKNSQSSDQLDPQALEELQNRDLERLKQMINYCHSKTCLRQFILKYFGEKAPNDCGNCFACQTRTEDTDVRAEAKLIVTAVEGSGARFGIHMLASLLCGADNEQTQKFQIQELPCFGSMKDYSQREVRDCILFLVGEGYLRQKEGKFPIIALGKPLSSQQKGKRTLTKNGTRAPVIASQRERNQLLTQLYALRDHIAVQKSVPSFAVFSDRIMEELCSLRPHNLMEIRSISGVSAFKAEQFGRKFVNLIVEFDKAQKPPESAITMTDTQDEKRT